MPSHTHLPLVLNVIALVSPVGVVLHALLRGSLPGGGSCVVIDVVRAAAVVHTSLPPEAKSASLKIALAHQ